MIEHLDDTVTLDAGLSRLDVRNVLVNSINTAWKARGNNATISAYANFVAFFIQENDKLRAALKPFVTAAKDADGYPDNNHIGCDPCMSLEGLTVGDLRRAREASELG